MDSRCAFIDFQQITSPTVRDFARYWQSKTAAATLPRRSAVDPLEIPHLLPFLVIVQIEALPLRIRYRLVGTRVAESHGADFTNRYLDECGFLIEGFLTDCYRRVTEARAPHYMYFEWMRADWPHDRGRIGACESGFFPLSSDGIAADMAITIEDPTVVPRRFNDPI